MSIVEDHKVIHSVFALQFLATASQWHSRNKIGFVIDGDDVMLIDVIDVNDINELL